MKGFGQLFVESWKEFFAKILIIFKVWAFLLLIPSVVLAFIFIVLFVIILSVTGAGAGLVGLTGLGTETSLTNIWQALGFRFLIPLISLGVIFIIAIIVLSIFMGISYINIGFSKKKEQSFRKVFNQAKPYFWKYVGLFFVQMLALFGLFLLFMVPGIIFMVYWIFSFYILIIEKKGIRGSLRKSKAVVRGRWWRVFGYGLLLSLIIGAASFIQFIPFIGAIISLAMNFFFTPFIILFFKNFYLDLLVTKGNVKKKKR